MSHKAKDVANTITPILPQTIESVDRTSQPTHVIKAKMNGAIIKDAIPKYFARFLWNFLLSSQYETGALSWISLLYDSTKLDIFSLAFCFSDSSLVFSSSI
ncbi:hypothetical protein HKA89_22560 [Vibrio parahaemolyticus]|nr:hypothetical protein [Vibrio parahaemolyticus]